MFSLISLQAQGEGKHKNNADVSCIASLFFLSLQVQGEGKHKKNANLDCVVLLFYPFLCKHKKKAGLDCVLFLFFHVFATTRRRQTGQTESWYAGGYCEEAEAWGLKADMG
eukprot:1160730-Pelagomonas_calceolata.AAC.7